MPTKPHDVNLSGVQKKVYDLGDLSREFLFSVSIPAMFGSQDTSTMTIFCQSARIPEFKLKPGKPIVFQKVNINLVDGINFVSWNPTFLSDDSNILRTNLLTWSSVAWDFNRKGAASPNSYKREIEVQQLNRKGIPVCKYTLVGAYPESVGGYTLDNSSRHLVKFDVSFQYDYFTFESYIVNSHAPSTQQIVQFVNNTTNAVKSLFNS